MDNANKMLEFSDEPVCYQVRRSYETVTKMETAIYTAK